VFIRGAHNLEEGVEVTLVENEQVLWLPILSFTWIKWVAWPGK
jgi:hypothetical protein